MESWELAAREQIRDLIARYNAYGDHGRFDEMVALFTADGVLQTDDETVTGPAELLRFFQAVAASAQSGAAGPTPSYVRHHTATLVIDVESPAEASARCYYQVLTTDGLDHWGRYADELIRVDGQWRFARRRVRLDGMQPGGWAAAYRQRQHLDQAP
ncbi:MAG TPA: nuclear transport factor 2 family protein [Mycobacteriales bacterium]|nr:nuclear transport factor 2 family protein [Mycobacteriales bacterium]